MWLKAFQFEDKLLSETEFWILTIVSDDFEPPTQVMSRLYQQTENWTPKPGTIYPILHRLSDVGLLEKIEDGGLSFKRSNKGRIFLSSIAKPLRVQVLESFNYFETLLLNLAGLNNMPARYHEILREVGHRGMDFANTCKSLSHEVQERMDKPYDVPISFDD